MGVAQQVWRRVRPHANAAVSRVTARRSRFPEPEIRVEGYQRAHRFVTVKRDVKPFEAGAYHLRLVLAAAETAGVAAAVIPMANGISYRVAIQQPAAEAFWQELVTQSAGTATYATWTGDWGVVTRLLSDCDVAKLVAAPDVLVHRFLRTDRRGLAPPFEVGCSVEHWLPSKVGKSKLGSAWKSRKPNPRHALVLWSEAQETTLDAPGLGPVPTLRAFLDDSLLVPQFPIDAVYLWVDDSDPAWRRRRDEVLIAMGRKPPADSADASRFRQLGELKYAMRSLEYFAPWIRRVFLVTDDQRPDWLVADDSIVTVVDHRDIWDDLSALPVFNSHAISSRIHHIPGLADSYLYINDDMFLGSPVLPRQFFTPAGQPVFHNSTGTLPDPALLSALPTHDNARSNAVRLVADATGLHPTRLFMHSPYAQSRAWQLELEDRFPDLYARTAASRFRSRTDLEPIWLHHYMGYVEGRTTSGTLRYGYTWLADPTTPKRLDDIARNRRAHVFCINDDGAASDANIEALNRFLPAYFPAPSRFEIPESSRSG